MILIYQNRSCAKRNTFPALYKTIPVYQNRSCAKRNSFPALYKMIPVHQNRSCIEYKTSRTRFKRMLTGVATEYGKDSPEYEAAGGVRKSERKKPVRKPKTA